MIQLLLGNCLDQLKTLSDNSIDSIVTDPPYGLSFMGKSWDYDVPKSEIWAEAMRVLKPGGHLLAFFGTRTYHRGAVAIEDAGFEIRDQIMWIYGSGFPKSHNIGKAIDKNAGAEREVVGKYKIPGHGRDNVKQGAQNRTKFEFNKYSDEPATEAAKQWDGWGTALKPANEPIVVARKPLEKGLTIAENVLKWGTGAINIDECRIGLKNGEKPSGSGNGQKNTETHGDRNDLVGGSHTPEAGRWPANIMFDEESAAVLDGQAPQVGGRWGKKTEGESNSMFGVGGGYGVKESSIGDTGGASRFFYVAKASKSERNKGLEGIGGREHNPEKESAHNQNFHPTVKPVKLMEYLIKLITPPKGIVLDPFMGSGTTGVAAKKLGFNFIGCELSEEYLEIAQKRITDAKTSKTSS